MRLKVGAATSIGKVRPINEDAFLVQADQGLFVVCDGMGGAAAGEVASLLAVQTISAYLKNGGGSQQGLRGFQPRTAQLGRAIEAANQAIIEKARTDDQHAGMGTTVVSMWFGDGLASIAHVGDSRAYLRNEAGFEALTKDHSLVEAQVQAGLIDREQSLKSEHQNILLRALGREPDMEVELGETMVAVGDRVLLCTDGLTRTVSDEGLAATLDQYRGNPQAACEDLIAQANDNGGPDNVTAVVIEFQGSRLSSFFRRS
ncbi:MAG: Stp1/IreP family PP2C-type Ser/Thr phosphatase [Cyanobacteria bacterium]|nr:Stp1/IreP family PP2C-type Ser/Thr phosphatase [Cyanobacteriota bacterium]